MTIRAAVVVAALVSASSGCGNKCDDLADELSKCPAAGQGGSGSGGADAGGECTEVEEGCASCLLDSDKSLCDQKGFQEAATACAPQCPP
jgi:hypothetical protein